MRLDKFLKVSRLIKRRTVANEACDAGRDPAFYPGRWRAFCDAVRGKGGSGCRDKIFVSESGDRPCACYFRTSYFPSGDGTVPPAAETTAYPVCDSSAGNDRFFDFLCGFKRKRGIYTAGGGHVSDLFVCGCDRICL